MFDTPSLWRFLVLAVPFLFAFESSVSALEVNSLSINISENPTANTNIFGTQFNGDGFVTDWGTDYMMIQLKLSASPQFTVLNLYLDAFANRGNQNTDVNNGLRFALFDSDPIANSLSDTVAISRTSINQALISPTFTDYLMGPGFADFVIDTEANYYFMIYAGGGVANEGYGLKVDKAFPVITFYAPDAPTPPVVQYYDGTQFAQASSQQPGGTAVPEPSAYVLGTIVALILGACAKNRTVVAQVN